MLVACLVQLLVPDLLLRFVILVKVKLLLLFEQFSSCFNTLLPSLHIFCDYLHLIMQLCLAFIKEQIFSLLFICLKRKSGVEPL